MFLADSIRVLASYALILFMEMPDAFPTVRSQLRNTMTARQEYTSNPIPKMPTTERSPSYVTDAPRIRWRTPPSRGWYLTAHQQSSTYVNLQYQ